MKRAVVLYPSFNDSKTIRDIRSKYDPLTNYIDPHITIVFPFDSDISTFELIKHFEVVLKGVTRFDVRLNGFTGDLKDEYLFLNVKKGNDEIIELHDKLYSQLLERFFCRHITFCPHLTVGKLRDQLELKKAIDELINNSEVFEAEIDKILVVNLDNSEKAITEFTFNLQ